MAFGTELQGQKSHEVLLSLQDAEIRMLETVKKYVVQRIKCDRDYAVALSSIVAVAQKPDPTPTGLPTESAWNRILSETEGLIQLMRDNADKLFQNTVESFQNIISEKKALRKSYADEHSRFSSELLRVQNAVNNCQTHYQQKVDKLHQNKLKYEEICKKGKPAAKITELQVKYVRSVGKVHAVHNDYVIALSEANLYQQHYVSVLLPALLEFQQRSQQNLIQQCKEAFVGYSSWTDSSAETFQKIHQNIHNVIQQIDADNEYKEFIMQHRTDPVQFSPFAFHSDILGTYSGILNPGEVQIDDTTLESVKLKYKSYCDDLDRIRQQTASKGAEIDKLNDEINQDSNTPSSSVIMLARRRTLEQKKRELMEQQCIEEKLKSLVKLLGEPLDRLGSEPPPLAVPDVTDSSTMMDSDSHSSSSSRFASALSSMQQGMTTIKTMAKRMGRNQHASVIQAHRGLPTPYVDSEVKNDNATNGPGSAVAVREVNDGPDGYQQFSFADDSHPQMTLHPDRPLDDEEWYHGVLPRDEVQRLLVDDGDYLVRASKNRKTNETQYVLSVMWGTHKHFIVQDSEGGYRFEGESFPTVQELIIYQHRCQQPVTRKSEAILKKPIFRADWELKNDDIELHQKIGSGQFGEVFRGTYKITGEEVAVKTCRETLSEDVKRKFLQEGRILKQYDHPNIVRFIGIAAQRAPVMIVMEFVSGGALLNFLRKHGQKQSQKTLIKMCKDAAAGMSYLEEKNCLHRDLAARNCLVDGNTTVKISDFGMSREEQEYVVSGGLKQIPIKWTAPEALNYGTYTSACDVWSYGVLVWEIFSFGLIPYPGLTNAQAREKVDDGYRMPPPENTPEHVYLLMMRCWDQEPKKRPRFSEIYSDLQRIFDETTS